MPRSTELNAPHRTPAFVTKHGPVLTPGALLREGETLRAYYGAADTVEAMATMPLSDVLAACERT